jgi:hypothetical protein
MGYVQISDSRQTEILFNVSQAQAENLAAVMVVMQPKCTVEGADIVMQSYTWLVLERILEHRAQYRPSVY